MIVIFRKKDKKKEKGRKRKKKVSTRCTKAVRQQTERDGKWQREACSWRVMVPNYTYLRQHTLHGSRLFHTYGGTGRRRPGKRAKTRYRHRQIRPISVPYDVPITVPSPNLRHRHPDKFTVLDSTISQ